MTENHKRMTDEQIAKILAMLDDYERSKWLGHLVWKITIAVGALVAGFAAFKEHLVSLFTRQ